VWVCV